MKVRHWWREFCTQTYRDARHAWEALRESSLCFQMEDDEFRATYTAPTFKATLIGLRGHGKRWQQPEAPSGCEGCAEAAARKGRH